MATLFEWTENKSYGDVNYRIEKVELNNSEVILIQQNIDGEWISLGRFTKNRIIFSIIEKLIGEINE